MYIQLEKRDYEICQVIGYLREVVNRKNKANDMRGSKEPNIGYYGMLGEYAFAKCFNFFPDVCLEMPDNRSTDFQTPDGKTIDVKTGMNFTEDMNVNKNKSSHPDYYVAMHVLFKEKTRCPKTGVVSYQYLPEPKVKLVGWIGGKDFVDKSVPVPMPNPLNSFNTLPYCLLRTTTPKQVFGNPILWNKK